MLQLSSGCTADQKSNKIVDCENSWEEISKKNTNEFKLPVDKMINDWGKYEDKCKATGVYEINMASLYFVKGDLLESGRILENATSYDEKYAALININKVQNNLQFDISKHMSKEEIRNKYNPILNSLKNKYSEYCMTHESISSFYNAISEYQESFKVAQEAVKCNINSWSGYRMLAISSVAIEDFTNTSEYCGKAQSINKNITADPYFMFSCAKGFAYKKDFETSDAIITIIDIKTPDAKSIPEYSETIKFIEHEKMANNKQL